MRCAASLLAVLVATPGLLADVLTVGPAGDHATIAAAVLAAAMLLLVVDGCALVGAGDRAAPAIAASSQGSASFPP